MSDLIRDFNSTESDKGSIKNNFELAYLRHLYFRRSKNPAPGRLAQFEEMITNIANHIYMKNIKVFKDVGMEADDLINIGRVHTVSFISMGGLYENPDLMKKFVEQHKHEKGENSTPTKKDIFLKECYNLAKFLKQRLQEVASFSKIKTNNIIGSKTKSLFFVGTPETNPTDRQLIDCPEKYGFVKITRTRFKQLQQQNNAKNKTEFIDENNRSVRVVYINAEYLTESDIENTPMSMGDNLFYRNPEDNLLLQEAIALEEKKNKKNKRKQA